MGVDHVGLELGQEPAESGAEAHGPKELGGPSGPLGADLTLPEGQTVDAHGVEGRSEQWRRADGDDGLVDRGHLAGQQVGEQGLPPTEGNRGDDVGDPQRRLPPHQGLVA